MPREHRGHADFTPYREFDFEAANKDYVENVFSEPDMVVGARSRVGIITCCDARCSPDHFFQLQPNEAFVMRTGGGRVNSTEVLRTLVSIQVLSDIKEIRVIHHTGKFRVEASVGKEECEKKSSQTRERESQKQ